MPEAENIRILSVEDHPVFRQGLATILATEPDMVLVGQASNSEEAMTEFRRHRPDVTLMAVRRLHPDALHDGGGTLRQRVNSIQQTPDGFLWLIVNGSGLARFDGRHFDPFAQQVTAITVGPDGGLWIGRADGLRRAPLETLPHFDLAATVLYQPGPDSSCKITSLRFDRIGVLWIGTEAGLFRFEDDRFTPVGPRVRIFEIEHAPNEHLLLVTAEGFMELDGARVVPLPELEAQLGTGIRDVFHVMEDRRGDVWYCTSNGVVRRSGTGWQKLSAYGPDAHGAFRTYEDAQGNVWGRRRLPPSRRPIHAASRR